MGPLAVQVPAGSGAYALSETVGLNFTRLDPARALYWSTVVNGVLAASVTAVMMLVASNGRTLGRFTLFGPMLAGGWLATLVMFAPSLGLFLL